MEPPAFLNLSSCIILELARYLDATSLYCLAKTHERFDEIITHHKSLWRFIDARRCPNFDEKIHYCIKRIHNDTRTVLLRGAMQLHNSVPNSLFGKLTTSFITVLALENQTLDCETITIKQFPTHLQELSLKNSWVENSTEFFRMSWDHLPDLRVLILDNCQWISSSCFMSISKYRNLQIFSVYNCRNLENSIAYLGLSGQWGFKKLKIFDARLTVLGNTLLNSFHKSQSILALYFQNDDICYKLDYFARKRDIIKGAKRRDFSEDDDEFDVINDTLEDELKGCAETAAALDERGLLDYITVRGCKSDDSWPKSILYLDPYNECKCRHSCEVRKPKHKTKNTHIGKEDGCSSSSDDDDDQPGNDNLVALSAKIKRLRKYITRTQSNRNLSRGISSLTRRRSHVPTRSPYNDWCVINISHLCDNSDNNNDTNGRQARLIVDTSHPVLRNNQDLDMNNERGQKRSIIDVHIFQANERLNNTNNDDNEEPNAKRARVDNPEAVAGPSNANNGHNNRPVERPPTPHPAFPEGMIDIIDLQEVVKTDSVPLRRLSLRGFRKITDASLEYINDLELELLDVTYTGVTETGISNFLVHHPQCRIVHELFCTCTPNLHF